MNPIISRKLRLIGEFSLIAVFAGIIYQLLREGNVSYKAIIMGASLGLGFGIIEVFIFSGLRKYFRKLPLLLTIFIKAFIYVIIINLFSGMVGLAAGLIQNKSLADFQNSMLSKGQLVLVIYTLMLYVFLSFYRQINLLLGEGVLLKFLFGKYRRPTGENRIFMFLDLKSSTAIAERLGHVNYYSFLNDFFHEISEPVRTTNAEIYQYVGDEVILTWKTEVGLHHSNCLKLFFRLQKKLHSKKEYYMERYGHIPDFKAGLHFGEVVSAQIGDIKREIVYNGDVLNTSARIQELCSPLDRNLLISGLLLDQLDIRNEYEAEKMDTVKLRGKESAIELYSLIESHKIKTAEFSPLHSYTNKQVFEDRCPSGIIS